MEPMKPQEIARILHERPHVSRDEISEYERLLSLKAGTNPYEMTAAQRSESAEHEKRLKELFQKLYR